MAPVLMSCDCVAPVSATAQLVVTTMPLLRIPTLSKAAVNFERWLIVFMGALPDDVEITGSRRAPRHALDCAFRSRFNEPAGTCRRFCHICGAALSPIEIAQSLAGRFALHSCTTRRSVGRGLLRRAPRAGAARRARPRAAGRAPRRGRARAARAGPI